MELSLNTLVDRLDDLFFERATRAWRIASGTQADAPLIRELPEVQRLDAWQVVSELLASPRVDEAKRGRLTLLQRHLARAYVEAQVAELENAESTQLATKTFPALGRVFTVREARRELSKLGSRDARVALAKALSEELEVQRSAPERRIDHSLEAITQLGSTPAKYWELLDGRAAESRLEGARTLLQETADAHRDLLGYALKKLDPLLTTKTATEHDGERAAGAPWLFELFRREDLVHAVSRCLGDLGYSANAHGRLTVDTDPRPGRDTGAYCFELRVPDQVRLLLTPDLGFETYAQWLSTWGLGLHRAHVGRTLPFVERRVGDRAVLHAVAMTFESFLGDEGWLKRYLRLTANQAREAARAFSFWQLRRMRRDAALATFSFDVISSGSTRSASDSYRDRLSAALEGEVIGGEAMFSVDLFGEALRRLDGWALSHVMHRHLLERFNEDHWRNPATGRWLQDLAAKGQRDDAPTVGKQLDTETLSAVDAARARVQRMGA